MLYVLMFALASVSCNRSNYELDNALKDSSNGASCQAVVSSDHVQLLLNLSDDVSYCTISGDPLNSPIKVKQDDVQVVTIDDLQPSTKYELEVSYYSSNSSLLYTKKVNFKTLGYEPSELDVMITDVRHAIIRFKCKTNDEIEYYTVSLIQAGRPNKVLSGSRRETKTVTFDAKDLKPDTSYEISYQAFYKNGGSSPVRTMRLKTLKMQYVSYFYFDSEYYPLTHLTSEVERDYDSKPIGRLLKYLTLHGLKYDGAVTQLKLYLMVPEYEGISNYWPAGRYDVTAENTFYYYGMTMLLKKNAYKLTGDYTIKYSGDSIICDFDLMTYYNNSHAPKKITGHFVGKYQK